MPALYAVAGNPVFHSKSPVMFNTAFRELAIEAVYLRLAASTPEEIVTTAREMGIQGFNVTTPFKTGVMRHLDFVTPDAERVGAVNTVVKRTEGLIGYNTDIAGALGAATRIGFEPSRQKVVILGAGGAARAAALAFVRAGAHVAIANRTFEKAREAAKMLGCEAVPLHHIADALKGARLLVSAISSADRVLDPSLLQPDFVVLEALYSSPTTLVSDAARQGMHRDRRARVAPRPGGTHFHPLHRTACSTSRDAKGPLEKETRLPEEYSPHRVYGNRQIDRCRAGGRNWRTNLHRYRQANRGEGRRFHRGDIRGRGEEVFRRMEQAEIDGLRLVSHHVASCGGGALDTRANVRTLRNNCLSVWLWANMSTILERTGENRARPRLFGLDAKGSQDLLRRRLPGYAACADLLINTEGKKPEEIAGRIWDEVHHAFNS